MVTTVVIETLCTISTIKYNVQFSMFRLQESLLLFVDIFIIMTQLARKKQTALMLKLVVDIAIQIQLFRTSSLSGIEIFAIIAEL